MDRRDSYLFKAAELLELAKNEHYEFKAESESLALAYLRLAEQAKQKDYLNIASETIRDLSTRFFPVRAQLKCHSVAYSLAPPDTVPALPTGGCVWREIDESSANEQAIMQ